ncbi:MAG: FAD-dependent oxidoreductase, partial [Dehalococcoidia bacterium]
MTNADVIIVGGGPTGLCAGAVLAKAGKRVILFEKDNYVGGRACSTTYKGHVFDNGPHLPSREGHLEDIFAEIGKQFPNSWWDFKGTLIHRDGKWVYLMDLLDRQKLREMMEEMVATSYEEIAKLDSVPIKDWVADRCDEEGMHLFWWCVTQGTFAGTRYEDFSAGDILYFFKETFERLGGWGGLWACVEGGYSKLIQPLYDSIIENGGEVRTGTYVDEIIIEDGKAVGVAIASGEKVVPTQILPLESIT